MAARHAQFERYARAEALYARGTHTLTQPAKPNTRVKLSDVRRYMEMAAELYLSTGKWVKAAKAYAACADAERKLGHGLVAGMYYYDAGEAAMRADAHMGMEHFSSAVTLLTAAGKFLPAAVLQRRIADAHADAGDAPEAAKTMAYAAALYESADDPTQAAYCLCEAGVLYADGGKFKESRDAFERAALIADDENLLRYGVPKMLMNAVLAALAHGMLPDAEELLKKYASTSAIFLVGRQHKFLADILAAIRALDLDRFIDHVWNYDYVEELKSFQLRMLLRCWKMMKAEIADRELRRKKLAEIAAARARKDAMKAAAKEDLSNLVGVGK